MSSSVNLNLTWNGYFAPPLGYPFRLWQGGFPEAQAFVRKGLASITATVSAEQGTISFSMGLYGPPMTSRYDAGLDYANLGPDGELVSETTIVATVAKTDLVLSLPSVRVPAAYVLRMHIANPDRRESPTLPYGLILHSLRAA